MRECSQIRSSISVLVLRSSVMTLPPLNVRPAAGGTLELFDYPGDGHLFTDPTLPKEYDPEATELLWSRVLPFVRACAAREGTAAVPPK